jgi:hypothetical protein
MDSQQGHFILELQIGHKKFSRWLKFLEMKNIKKKMIRKKVINSGKR